MEFTQEEMEFIQRMEKRQRRKDVLEYISPLDANSLLEEAKKNGKPSQILYKDKWLNICRGDLFDQVRSHYMTDMRNYGTGYGARVTDNSFIIIDSMTDG